jgi:hypothetical protein
MKTVAIPPWFCTVCKQEIKDGDLMVKTGNGKMYHHPKCSQGVPLKGNKNVRNVQWFSKGVRQMVSDYWCDRCRVFTDNPEKHKHEERPLD